MYRFLFTSALTLQSKLDKFPFKIYNMPSKPTLIFKYEVFFQSKFAHKKFLFKIYMFFISALSLKFKLAYGKVPLSKSMLNSLNPHKPLTLN